MYEHYQMRLKKWHVGMIAILLAVVVKVPDLWADMDEMAQLLIKRLPEHAKERYHHTDISPNGEQVAFSVSTDSRNKSVIWVYDIPSEEMLQLTEPDTTMNIGDVHVQWSPDGDTPPPLACCHLQRRRHRPTAANNPPPPPGCDGVFLLVRRWPFA